MFDSFRGAMRTFARRLVLRRPARRATYPRRSLWSGKVVLARLALHACCHDVGVPVAMLEPGPFLSRCGVPAVRLAARPRTQAVLARHGQLPPARDALPEPACRQLVRDTGRESEAQSPAEWLWHGRRVRVVDGSTITMPDTPENQAEYPQAKTQKPGCGLPIARILVIFSLATGAVLEAAIGRIPRKKTGENSLFRTLHDVLEAGDVALADRHFSGWFDIALLGQRGVDAVLRKHQKRATDFRTGQRLGSDDHLVQPGTNRDVRSGCRSNSTRRCPMSCCCVSFGCTCGNVASAPKPW